MVEQVKVDNSLPKNERLCGVSAVQSLFTEGDGFTAYPLRCVYNIKKSDVKGVKILVSVGKKYHKRAVKRNKIKRRIREAYRTNKNYLLPLLGDNISIEIAFIYISKNEEDFKTIENGIKKGFSKLLTKIIEDSNRNPVTAD